VACVVCRLRGSNFGATKR